MRARERGGSFDASARASRSCDSASSCCPASAAHHASRSAASTRPEVARAAMVLDIVPGLAVPVALRGHLLALKILARDDDRRPQDLVDIRALLQVATELDVATCRQALQLITDRGFNRNRDLAADLDALLEPSSRPDARDG